jgi:hypothetical protein
VNAVYKGQTLRMTVKKLTTVTRKHEGAISEMEKLLKMWIEAQIQKRVLLSLMTIKAKARNLSGELKGKYCGVQAFVEAVAGFHSLNNVQIFITKCLERLLVEMLKQKINFQSGCKIL